MSHNGIWLGFAINPLGMDTNIDDVHAMPIMSPLQSDIRAASLGFFSARNLSKATSVRLIFDTICTLPVMMLMKIQIGTVTEKESSLSVD